MGIAIDSWGEHIYHLPSTDPVSVWHCPLEHLEWLLALKFPPSCDLKSVFFQLLQSISVKSIIPTTIALSDRKQSTWTQ